MKRIHLGSALAATVLAACASDGPRPDAQIARAEASLVQAEQAGARQYAGTDFDAARDKLGEAQRLAEKGDNTPAMMLAEQARVDAELAAARARHQSADQAAEEVRAATARLREEVNRGATGGATAPPAAPAGNPLPPAGTSRPPAPPPAPAPAVPPSPPERTTTPLAPTGEVRP